MNYTSGTLKTKDNKNIAYNLYERAFDTVLVIAHGWLMTKDSNAFRQMSEDFAKFYDVITFDFRGHGKSSGVYTFGAEELADLSSVIDFAKTRYNKIYLIGFSLGSLVSINYCADNKNVDKLIAVSAPTDFEHIENNMISPNALIPTLKKFELDRWLSIRMNLPFMKKIKPLRSIRKIKIPKLLIAGEFDPIIRAWHNERLYKNAVEPKKAIMIKKGKHAEDLYLEHKDYFMDCCINWLEGK